MTDCKSMMKSFVLKDLFWYQQKYFIALLVAVFFTAMFNKHYPHAHEVIRFIVIPVLIFVIVVFFLNILAESYIDKDNLKYMTEKCHRMIADPYQKNKMSISGKDVENYAGIFDTPKQIAEDVFKMDDNIQNMTDSTEVMGLNKNEEDLKKDDEKQKKKEDFVNFQYVASQTKSLFEKGANELKKTFKGSEKKLEEKFTGMDVNPNYFDLNEEKEQSYTGTFTDKPCLTDNTGYIVCSGVDSAPWASVPGGNWQVPTAEETVKRLNSDEYTKDKCF